MEAEGRAGSLENQDLRFLLTPVVTFIAEYGWYLLLLSGGVYVLIQHLRKIRFRQDRSSASTSSPDPVSVVRRQEAMEAARQRMQAELDARAAQFKEKQQRMEEEKIQHKVEMWDSMKEGKSYIGKAKLSQQNSDEAASSSTVLKPKTDKKPLRSGYNPLSGDGGGTCSWRPGRRGPSAGG